MLQIVDINVETITYHVAISLTNVMSITLTYLHHTFMLWMENWKSDFLCRQPIDLAYQCCRCGASFGMKLAKKGSGSVVSSEGILYQSLAQMYPL